eukprot:GHVN01019392.1.p1 GENE.GHVN01019392.1~~GHVN01019392.1.p1  ORF type:complete len:439 (+),score=50.15 GHVN01019392.1:300-1616(+)
MRLFVRTLGGIAPPVYRPSCKAFSGKSPFSNFFTKTRIAGFPANSDQEFLKLGSSVILEGRKLFDIFPTILQQLESNGTTDDNARLRATIELLDTASNTICRVADLAELIRRVHPSPDWRGSANAVVELATKEIGELNLNSAVHDALTHLKNSELFANRGNTLDEDATPWLNEAKLVAKDMIRTAAYAGAHHTAEDQQHLVSLLEAEQGLGFHIGQRDPFAAFRYLLNEKGSPSEVTLSAKLEPIYGVPVQHLIKEKNGSNIYSAGLDDDGQLAVRMRLYGTQHSTDEEESMKRYLLGVAIDNISPDGPSSEIASLLYLREQIAKLRGFESWGQFEMRGGVFTSHTQVSHFLSRSINSLSDHLAVEIDALVRFQKMEKKVNRADACQLLTPWNLIPVMKRCSDKVLRSSSLIPGKLERTATKMQANLLFALSFRSTLV